MTLVQHFSHGALTPVLGYAASFVGAFIGLQAAIRARSVTGLLRARWLLLAAVSLGGTGIWVMHFTAMFGFYVGGTNVRYDIALTLASLALAVAAVGAGLWIGCSPAPSPARTAAAALVAGAGLAGMHYLGMAALRMHAEVAYDPLLVGGSVLLALAGGAAVVWTASRAERPAAVAVGALAAGALVGAMHYTAMFAMDITATTITGHLHGASVMDFLLPIAVGLVVLTFVPLAVIVLSPDDEELRTDDAFRTELRRLRADGVQPAAARPAAADLSHRRPSRLR
ncbi:MHYT domain-containing protein [Allonocardiopsis opalescens]|uniref:NO-binding membrane sensor protein with MHYT domain n=1 Tax=Allonocardiopsis opalescens TaxID=1144618 RepID=A0A2T0PPW4_9ACTN|nr:MHYT domain-containing protein [Allonocardiopsis opalescens]PRX90924.1 NO-binding membrane sensor protein with MHYT domain [Allonocardiopsis opalescens]